MDIKKKLREALLKEEKKAQQEYGCTMLFFKINKEKWEEIQGIIKEEDLYVEENDSSFGRAKLSDVHCTVLFGTHLDVPNEDVYKIIEKFEEPDIKFKGISSFSSDKKSFGVIKFDIESEKLTEYNKELKKLPYTSDFPKYHAHCTICYCKKDKVDEYVKKLKDFKITDKDFTIDKWVYSKQGDKKSFKI